MDESTQSARPIAPSRRGLIVGLLLCVVAIAFEAVAVVTAMPAAEADLGQVELYAWAFTAFMIAQTFAIVAAGQASDRVGPKQPLVVGFIVFAAGLVIAGTAPNMLVLVAGRFVQGLGGGTMNLAVMVLVARLFDARERAVVITWMSFAWMLPAFIGPTIAAWLSLTWSWHLVFFSVLPVMAVGGALIFGPLRRIELAPVDQTDAVPSRTGHRLRSAALVALGAAALQVAGQHIELLSLLWLAAGIALLGFGLPPLLPRGYRPTGTGLAANVNLRMLAAGAFFGADTFLTLMLVRSEGLNLSWGGVVVTIGSAGWTTGSWLQSRSWLRLRRDTIASVGAALTAAGLALIAVAAWFPGSLLGLIIGGWVVAGLGMGLHMASTSLVVMQLSAEPELGRNSSSLQVGEALGNALAAGIAGTLFALAMPDQRLAFGILFTAMGVIAAAALVSSLRIGPVVNHSIVPPDPDLYRVV
ncbi:MAG: MFS transporter [Propionibacteriaceae bacterium]|nr:MFS transporter [Propionibacteriaceae bacterium]